MSFKFDIPALGTIAGQIIGGEVRNAISDNIGRGLDALDAGDNVGAAQAFSQAAAVISVAALQTIYMTRTLAPIREGLNKAEI